jgi:hypothetical protein
MLAKWKQALTHAAILGGLGALVGLCLTVVALQAPRAQSEALLEGFGALPGLHVSLVMAPDQPLPRRALRSHWIDARPLASWPGSEEAWRLSGDRSGSALLFVMLAAWGLLLGCAATLLWHSSGAKQLLGLILIGALLGWAFSHSLEWGRGGWARPFVAGASGLPNVEAELGPESRFGAQIFPGRLRLTGPSGLLLDAPSEEPPWPESQPGVSIRAGGRMLFAMLFGALFLAGGLTLIGWRSLGRPARVLGPAMGLGLLVGLLLPFLPDALGAALFRSLNVLPGLAMDAGSGKFLQLLSVGIAGVDPVRVGLTALVLLGVLLIPPSLLVELLRTFKRRRIERAAAAAEESDYVHPTSLPLGGSGHGDEEEPEPPASLPLASPEEDDGDDGAGPPSSLPLAP